MQTSAAGVDFLERHEGVVLKVYPDVVGVLTIGAGLTASSGVIVPKRGMTITRDEARALLMAALARNYEPAVQAEMPGAVQHEFDAGVSFHFNTGAISRASWVEAWHAGDWDATRARLLLWIKGGGKVLPGLKNRREEEYTLLRHGVYHGALPARAEGSILATEVVPLSSAETEATRAGFASLGYEPGPDANGVLDATVRDFQRDHDLTIDGIIGRATLTTLQRMLDARTKVATTGASATGAAGGAVAAGGDGAAAPDAASLPIDALPWIEWLAWAAVVLCLARLAWLAWSYRDAVAARVQARAPSLAALLRRF